HPLPKTVARLHNARPATVRSTLSAAGAAEDEKPASQGVDVLQTRAKMCGSPDGNGLRATTEREAEINLEQGVDGCESRAKIGGSLGGNGHRPALPGQLKETPTGC